MKFMDIRDGKPEFWIAMDDGTWFFVGRNNINNCHPIMACEEVHEVLERLEALDYTPESFYELFLQLHCEE